MPFYPEAVLQDLRDQAAEIRAFTETTTSAVQAYREALVDLLETRTAEELREDLGVDRYPGALPTAEFDDRDTPVVAFDCAADWEHHEAVNAYAKSVLEGVTTAATDGSELGPTTEFSVPLGLVQVAWVANHHDADGRYDEGVRTKVLAPNAVTREGDGEDDLRYVDGRIPGHERYRLEGETAVSVIERFADRDPPPIVLYDGPLVPTFANTYDPEIRDSRYRQTMTTVLAASQFHGVPVVGYSAGSTRTNLAKLLRRADRDRLGNEPFVPDYRILEGFTENWGDRSLVFVLRQDGTVDAMHGTYRDEEFAFSTDVHFTYLETEGPGMDYLEFPGWIQRAGLEEMVFDVVRAETGVGRGYPEILQQADANAVLDAEARRRFLALVQDFAAETALPIEWNRKDLSKARRRR